MTLLKTTAGAWTDGGKTFQPFSLALALNGEPVVTRDGRKVQEIRIFSTVENQPLVVAIDGRLMRLEKDGREFRQVPSNCDLFMQEGCQ